VQRWGRRREQQQQQQQQQPRGMVLRQGELVGRGVVSHLFVCTSRASRHVIWCECACCCIFLCMQTYMVLCLIKPQYRSETQTYTAI
jgi:hypothetical protein